MNKYYLLIGVLAVASLIVAAYFLQQLTVEYDGEFLKELEEERHLYAETEKIRAQKQDIRKMFEFTSLEKEKAEEAQQIAQSDDNGCSMSQSTWKKREWNPFLQPGEWYLWG